MDRDTPTARSRHDSKINIFIHSGHFGETFIMQILKTRMSRLNSPLQICHLAWTVPRQRGVCKAPLSQSGPGGKERRQEKERWMDGLRNDHYHYKVLKYFSSTIRMGLVSQIHSTLQFKHSFQAKFPRVSV